MKYSINLYQFLSIYSDDRTIYIHILVHLSRGFKRHQILAIRETYLNPNSPFLRQREGVFESSSEQTGWGGAEGGS